MADEPTPKRRVVALVGFAPMTRMLAPVDNPDIEIWTLNEARMMGVKRIDRLFQMHPRWCWDPPGGNHRDPEYVKWLQAQTCPIYMFEKQRDIPASVAYPLDEMVAMFDGYLTSTFSYQIALCIYEKVDEIQIFGIDLSAEEEYRYQRAGAEYLLGYAKAKGITVTIPPDCPLLKSPLYGLYTAEEAKTTFTQEILDHRLNELNQQKAQAVATLNALEGAIQETNNWRMKHARDINSNAGLEHKRFAGLETVQEGATVAPVPMPTSDGTGHHVGLLQEVKV